VATYEYRCERHGAHEAAWPLGTAPESMRCAVCGGEARRIFSSPMLSFSSPASREITAAIERAEKSRDQPEVVTALPPRAAHKRTPVLPLTPTLRRLPRP
jgi:putative FmdB family regulatory protein